jgi:prolyl 4-hydroxylase
MAKGKGFAGTTDPTSGSVKKAPAADATSTTNQSSSSGVGPLSLLIATISLLAGLITPSLMDLWASHGGNTSAIIQRVLLNTQSSSIEPPKDSKSSQLFPCNQETLSKYLHEQPVIGLHLFCLEPSESRRDGVQVTLYPGAAETDCPKTIVMDHDQLQEQLEEALSIAPHGPKRQPYAIFSPLGEKLVLETDRHVPIDNLMRYGTLLLYEGGQWLWPGVRPGFKRTIQLDLLNEMDDPSRNVTLETLSLRPLVLSVNEFLTPTECDLIQKEATPSLRYSEVTLMDHDAGRPASDFRTSQSTFLGPNGKPWLRAIEDRTASLVRIPRLHQEYVQVLRYGHGEKYDPHHDFFDPSLYQNDKQTLQLIENGRRNRLATVFWYLSDVEKGGATTFPNVPNGPRVDFSIACQQGLQVYPARGKVIIFYSLLGDGTGDDYSLHVSEELSIFNL